MQFNHGFKSDVSVFELLYNMSSVMLTISQKKQTKTVAVYRKILWSKYILCSGDFREGLGGYSYPLFVTLRNIKTQCIDIKMH